MPAILPNQPFLGMCLSILGLPYVLANRFWAYAYPYHGCHMTRQPLLGIGQADLYSTKIFAQALGVLSLWQIFIKMFIKMLCILSSQ